VLGAILALHSFELGDRKKNCWSSNGIEPSLIDYSISTNKGDNVYFRSLLKLFLPNLFTFFGAKSFDKAWGNDKIPQVLTRPGPVVKKV
jgi:hypothetical protein